MKKRARELEEFARQHRSDGELKEAGRSYTLASHEYAGEAKLVFPEPGSQELVMRGLLNAATCYRIIDDNFRTQNRCDLGIILANDHIHYIEEVGFDSGSFGDIRRGCWPEFIGDFRTIANRENADEAYNQAISIYKSAGDYDFVTAEQEHMALTAFFRSVREGLGHNISSTAPEKMAPGTTFSEWVEYKREKLPIYLDRLEELGEWPLEYK